MTRSVFDRPRSKARWRYKLSPNHEAHAPTQRGEGRATTRDVTPDALDTISENHSRSSNTAAGRSPDHLRPDDVAETFVGQLWDSLRSHS